MKRKKISGALKSEYRWGLLLCSPPLIGVLVFLLIPMILSLILSVSELHGYMIEKMSLLPLSNLFGNYGYVLTDPLFWKSMGNTFIYALSLPLSLIVSLVISAMLVSIKRGRAFFYSIFFIPHICSIIALTQVWKVLLNYNYGIINEVINGIFGKRVDWLGTQGGFMTAMIFMSVWQSIGFQVVLLTSGLSNIEKTYYEAASLDGASPFVCFLRITVPQISPIIFYLFVTGMIGSLQEFTRMQSITAGGMGPNQCAVTMVYYLYNMGFNYTFSFGMGYATACAWIIAAIIFVVSVVNFKYVQKLVSYD